MVLKNSWLRLGIILVLFTFGANAQLRLAPDTESPPERKYARSPEIDILHLAIDITPDFKAQSIRGKTVLKFKPIAKPFDELHLDAIDFLVKEVSSTEKLMGWQATDKEIIVTFAKPIPADREAAVTITYSATPRKGLYFRTPEMGYKPGDTHFWTQCESEMARYWIPCIDSPNLKFTSEVTCHLPQDMVALSNGKLVSEHKDSSGLVATRWLQDKPHVSYLIFLAGGYFKKIEDRYKDIPLAFYTPASEIAYASNSFAETREMMAFFEKETGVPYPWAKYYQVCVNDFTAGGMENTSITCLNDNTLHSADFGELRESRGLIAHELAHQWFGDLVTCKDWANIWLNEGFATFYEHLYDGYKNGPDTLKYRFYTGLKSLVNDSTTNAMVRRVYRDPDELFDGLAYGKGGWILHMLRSQLGEDLYRKCIKTYLEKYAYKNATTEDLKSIIENLSGRNYDQFFDQWVYHAGSPDLQISYAWDEKTKIAKVTVAQQQKLSDRVLLFNVPLPIRFKLGGTNIDRTITVKAKSEDFLFPLPAAPELIRIDPEITLLAKINFTNNTAMQLSQLSDSSDAIGRLMACEQLSGKREAQAKLKEVLNNDPFYVVRQAASRSLRAIQSDDVYEDLLASVNQPDPRVRGQVLSDVFEFYREKSGQLALKTAKEEKNPQLKAAAINALGAYSPPDIQDTLVKLLKTPSFRNIIAESAIRAMRAQDNPVYVQPIRELLENNEQAFSSYAFPKSLENLAYLSRNLENRGPMREFLASYLTSSKRRVRVAAINGLGTLGDSKAIAVIENFTTPSTDAQERTAADRALTALRETKKPYVELGNLRNEVTTLQKDNRELRKELDDLKKKIETSAIAKVSTTKTNTVIASPKAKAQ